jgi:hypothetical protein
MVSFCVVGCLGLLSIVAAGLGVLLYEQLNKRRK